MFCGPETADVSRGEAEECIWNIYVKGIYMLKEYMC